MAPGRARPLGHPRPRAAHRHRHRPRAGRARHRRPHVGAPPRTWTRTVSSGRSRRRSWRTSPGRRSSTMRTPQSSRVMFEETDEGEARLVLTRRSSGLRTHRGEVSFPGGRLEKRRGASGCGAARGARRGGTGPGPGHHRGLDAPGHDHGVVLADPADPRDRLAAAPTGGEPRRGRARLRRHA